MKSTLRIAAVAFLGLVAVLVVVGFLLPTDFHVERSIVINASSETIHPFINDVRHWPEWAAWNADTDPTLEYEYPGKTVGEGAVYEWHGDRTGDGLLRITKSDPARGVWAEMALEGGELDATTELTYQPADGGTRVTWSHSGTLPRPLGGYLRGYLESVLDEHFDHGLRGLKKLAEAQPDTDGEDTDAS